MPRRSKENAREDLHARLDARWPEIEQAVLTRVFAVEDPSESLADPEYTEGLRAAVGASLRYGLAAVKLGEERSPPPPPELLSQTRFAARSGVSLDTVLRRCFAGHALFSDFIVAEAEAGGLLERTELQSPLRTQATVFDRLMAAVSEEYAREEQERSRSTRQRDAKRIERLLAGELIDTAEIAYPLGDWHIGAIAKGEGAREALRELASSLDRRLLSIEREEGTTWAWLGGRRAMDPKKLQGGPWPAQMSLAIGEAAQGLSGWRLTHRQTRAAWPIALRGPERVVRYAEVAVLASILKDDLLVTSLRQLYLAPLEEERDGGEVARETLRAYFSTGRQATSAAVVLGVSRQTVNSRLRAIEERLGSSLSDCATELEAALRMEELSNPLLASAHHLPIHESLVLHRPTGMRTVK